MAEQVDEAHKELLTEHFGYPVLTVVDDVINAINHILYKCTAGMDNYLRERRKDESNNNDSVWSKLTEDEISYGTVKFETLLENQVDINFDKFELYALRNIFMIPKNLIEDGWIRLKHHEGMKFKTDLEITDDKIKQLVADIHMEKQIRRVLLEQIEKSIQILKVLKSIKVQISKLNQDMIYNSLSEDGKKTLNNLLPVKDSFKFVLMEFNSLVDNVNSIYEKFAEGKISLNANFKPSWRDYYIQGKTFKLLEDLGANLDANGSTDVLDPSNSQQNLNDENLNNLKTLNDLNDLSNID